MNRASDFSRRLLDGVMSGDEADIARAIEELSRSRRYLAPLAYAVGGVAMLLGGVRLLFSNWRLTLIQVLPAIWIWLAMYNLRAHLLHGREFRDLEGPFVVLVLAAIVAITIGAFFFNAVFGFAVAQGGRPDVRLAIGEARKRLRPIAATGGALGLALGLAVLLAPRAGESWFAVSLGVVIGLMMAAYVAVPSRLVGVETKASRRDRLSASAVGGLLGVALATPPYLLGRIGLLMIGSPILRWPGFVIFLVAATLQAGATSAVRAVKLGAKLGGGPKTTRSEAQPAAGALEEVRRLAVPAATVVGVSRLEGGQHADTWRVDTEDPATSVVVRQFPVGDPGFTEEERALRALDGLGGLAPVLLGGDPGGRWSQHPTSLISWLDGRPDITPADPMSWARELGSALAAVHAVPVERVAELPSVFDSGGGSREILAGPLAEGVRSRWSELVDLPQVLVHCDYWSGNVVWRDGRLTGIVDWPAASRGPRGFDLGWCRLDLVLLFDEQIADGFLTSYEAAAGQAVGDVRLWDCWALARSEDSVGSWGPNYLPLGRADLDEGELRRRHAQWTARLA